ncbi:MAG: hypothetical protein J7641_00055 [Cyanobacteria bacterium SID2]|nr:hypothetical protein [Cyanobacteria bacterium SID2]
MKPETWFSQTNPYELFAEPQIQSNLLQKLKNTGNILFVGERSSLNVLERYLTTSVYPNSYIWESQLEDFLESCNLSFGYEAVAIASVKDEHALFDRVSDLLISKEIQIPVLKLFSDIFVNSMTGRELLTRSDCEFTPPKLAYAIVSTPRCGTTLLCSLLESTGVAGYPKEHLQRPSQLLTLQCRLDWVRYIQMLMTHNTTPNGVFGTKIISHFLQEHQKSEYKTGSL